MAQDWEEERLIAMILSGEERKVNAAAEEICRLSWPMVARIVRIGGGSDTDVQTVIDDAILALFDIVRSGAYDRERAALKTLYYRIAKNKWLDEIGRRFGNSSILLPLNAEFEGSGTRSQDRIENRLFAREEEAEMDRALGKLDAPCRELINMIYTKGVSLRVVAENLGLSEDAVKKRHQRCKEKLRAILGRDPRIG